MKNCKLIILRGNSGSGKTTIAKMLKKSLGEGVMLISQDVIRREILFVKDGEGNLSIDLIKDMVFYGNKNFDYVILEGIFYSKWYNEMFIDIKEKFNEIYAYYFDITFEETLNRHRTRENCNEFGKKEMKTWWRDKDYLKTIEEIAITKDKNEDEIIKLILENLKKS